MAFFDDLGKKLSQAGQNVAQKTKDFSEVSKLNSAISDEEKKINNICLQLGKEYYAKHVADSEAYFEQYVLAIKEAEGKIAMLHQQIKDIRGVVRCERCGTEIPNNAPFCSGCGAPAPVKTPAMSEGGIVCPSCRQTVPAGTKFCTSCGAPIAPAAPVAPVAPVEPAATPVAPVEPVAAPAEEPVTYAPTEEVTYAPAAPVLCPGCGAELLPGTSFCTNCGTKVN